MKFISKNANLRVVLKHGIPAEPIIGRAAVPGLYVKFEDGIANVNDEEMSKQMQAHPGFNHDFVSAEDVQRDPYASYRKEKEPMHQITDLKYGTFDKSTGVPPRARYTAEQMELIKSEAMRLAQEIAPEMAKEMVKTVLKQSTELKEEKQDVENSQFPCGCGFQAKSQFGLDVHKRSCKKTISK